MVVTFARGWRAVVWGVNCFIGSEFPFGKINRLWNWRVGMVVQQYERT